MNYCQSCGEVKDLVIAEGVYYCNKCLPKREFVMQEVLNEKTRGFEEVIFEKEPMVKDEIISSFLSQPTISDDGKSNFLAFLRDNNKSPDDLLKYEDEDVKELVNACPKLSLFDKPEIKLFFKTKKKEPKTSVQIIPLKWASLMNFFRTSETLFAIDTIVHLPPDASRIVAMSFCEPRS